MTSDASPENGLFWGGGGEGANLFYYCHFILQTNTYQGIIITDTVFSYYLFSYTCGDIEWSGQGFETAIVGYSSKADFFGNHPANGFQEIGQVVSCTRQIISERRRKRNAGDDAGVACVLDVDPDLIIARMKCEEIANFDDSNIADITSIVDDVTGATVNAANEVTACPPFSAQAVVSPQFVQADEQGTGCFRSEPPYTPDATLNNLEKGYEFVSVCCYNSIG